MDDLISRQAAIDAVDVSNLHRGIVSALQEIIRELPSAQPNLQQTCNQLATDCIDRQAAIDAIQKDRETGWKDSEDDIVYRNACDDGYAYSIQVIRELLSVERKKGKWKERKVFDTEDSDISEMQSAKCSVCGKYHTTPYLYFFDNFNFCPNCGADMRGEG